MPSPRPISNDFSSDPIVGGNDVMLTVKLDQPTSSPLQVTLTVSPTGILTGPVTIPPNKAPFPTRCTVPAGSDHVDVPLSSNAVSSNTTVTVTATANGGSASGQITVNP